MSGGQLRLCDNSRLVRVWVWLLLTVFPLLCLGYSNITALKTRFFYAGMAVFIVALLLSMRRRPGLRCLLRLPLVWALLAMLLLSALAALTSPYGWDSWLGQGRGGGMLALLLYAALLISCALLGQGGRREIYAVGATLLLMDIVALLQLAGLNPGGFYPQGWSYQDAGTLYNGVFLSTVGNTNQLGAIFCLYAAALVAYVTIAPQPWRWLLLTPVGLSLYIMGAAGMEGALCGLAGGLLLLSPWLLTKDKRCRRRLLLTVAALLLLFVLLLYFSPAASLPLSLAEARSLLHGEAQDSFGSYRLGIWGDTLHLIAARPGLGFGPDCFRAPYAALTGGAMGVDAAHNVYLHLAACCGVPAAMAYATALLLSIISLLRQGEKDRRAYIYAAALACWAIQACFNFSTPLSTPLLMTAWGLGLSLLIHPGPGRPDPAAA